MSRSALSSVQRAKLDRDKNHGYTYDMSEDISVYLDKDRSLQSTSTISEVIFRDIKESIFNRKLKPNQRIKIGDIASYLGVSQTPVREAIQRLAAERLVVIDKRSEVKVVEVGITECKEIAELLRILDSACQMKIIVNITGKDIDVLSMMLEEMEADYASGRIDAYILKNQAIHKRTWKIIGNNVIYETLSEFMERMHIGESWYSFYFNNPSFLKKGLEAHRGMLAALAGRDEQTAVRLALEHW